MFRLAHSLGYPHPDLMLASMGSSQFAELMQYFRIESSEKDRLKDETQDAKVAEFLRAKMRRQKRLNG